MSAVVINIPSYDVILPLTWFRSANPTINWAHSEVTVKDRKWKHKLQLRLQPYLDKFAMVYLDNIIIFSNSDQEHKEHLSLVLESLRTNKLYAKPSKFIVGAETVEFCGHIVGQGQLRTAVLKTKLVEEWPTPSNIHEVRQLLGLA
ncbi:hypothetical protein V491_03426 [Pseudogymnoascus sp. VKM F-3775]|nr:hypothetical protein V491_03426 [Pseudogymnoascus sp. VKM F-3775]